MASTFKTIVKVLLSTQTNLYQRRLPAKVCGLPVLSNHGSLTRFSSSFPKVKQSTERGVTLTSVKENPDQLLELEFGDKSRGSAPILWLRDNCQCPDCFDPVALARKFLIQNLDVDTKPKDIKFTGNSLVVTWSDFHVSNFDADWLHKRAFNPETKDDHEIFHRLPQKSWGNDFKIKKFNYGNLIDQDVDLLKFLTILEVEGAALVQNTPNDSDAGAKLSDHIRFVKKTHYGRTSGVYNRKDANNLAFKSGKLGLHVDLPFYEYQPGLILLHVVEQHKEKGGESTMSDGLFCGEWMRRNYPKEFELLTQRNVYFWDKGVANVETEMDFCKTSKHPIIKLDSEDNIIEIRYNNQVRDTFMDIHPKEVNAFYRAMKIFEDIITENSVKFKLADGEILILDNVRCLHGRESFCSSSNRHLETSYLDWDEARCRRRLLEEAVQ